MASEFMQAVYQAAVAASADSSGIQELRGLSRTQFLEVVKTVCGALGELPAENSMHVAVLGVTFVRNALLSAMAANQQTLIAQTGGTA